MSKINFEEDVANIDQESLESVSSLLQQQLIMENEVEMAELELKDMLIKEAGVAPSFGSGFGKNSGKFARFNIACRTEILDLAINRLTKTFL